MALSNNAQILATIPGHRHKPGDELGETLQAFYDSLPAMPWCSNDKTLIGAKFRPKAEAIKYPYIQANHPDWISSITLDLDFAGSEGMFHAVGLPLPNLTVNNPENDHSNVTLNIDPMPLKRASKKSLALLEYVKAGLKKLLKADKVITNQKQLVKNPFHEKWRVFVSDRPRYTLWELAEAINNAIRRQAQQAVNVPCASFEDVVDLDSRNVSLFDAGRSYAYGVVSRLHDLDELDDAVLNYITGLNDDEIPQQFSKGPLPEKELRGIAKSISRWVWERREKFGHKNVGVMGLPTLKGVSRPHDEWIALVREHQAAGGRYTAGRRRTSTEDKILWILEECAKEGMPRPTYKIMAACLGISKRTLCRYKDLIDGFAVKGQGVIRSISGLVYSNMARTAEPEPRPGKKSISEKIEVSIEKTRLQNKKSVFERKETERSASSLVAKLPILAAQDTSGGGKSENRGLKSAGDMVLERLFGVADLRKSGGRPVLSAVKVPVAADRGAVLKPALSAEKSCRRRMI